MVSLAAAVVIASVAAAFSFPYRYYLSWYSWGRHWPITFIIGVYFVIAGGGGGFLGWLVAEVAKAAPTKYEFVNGALFGVAGTLALRTDLRAGIEARSPQPGRAPTAAPRDYGLQARTLLGYGLLWVQRSLDDEALERALSYFSRHSDAELSSVAWGIHARIAQDGRSPARVRAEQRKLLLTMLTGLGAGSDDERNEARAQLRLFAARYCVSGHLTRKTAASSLRL